MVTRALSSAGPPLLQRLTCTRGLPHVTIELLNCGTLVAQLELVLRSEDLPGDPKADVLKEMFRNLQDTGDHLAAFCFGEAAVRGMPARS
jgi:hypothetical protein